MQHFGGWGLCFGLILGVTLMLTALPCLIAPSADDKHAQRGLVQVAAEIHDGCEVAAPHHSQEHLVSHILRIEAIAHSAAEVAEELRPKLLEEGLCRSLGGDGAHGFDG